MSGTESLADVTLRPWPTTKKDELSPQDLLQQIEQLANERGHLRNITEKSLLEDVIAGKEAPADAEGESEEKTDKKDKQDAPSKEERLQEVLRMHHEMSTHME
jgi:mediator of RNA polymerase II transcription subunit 17